jgi:metal-responsive CopG/Arc/MetJ family transcriptional regulator
MESSAKISISLPTATLRAADRERRSTRETRSQFFRRAVEELVQRRRKREEIDRYVAGYVAEPEGSEEAWVDELGREQLEQENWD